MPEKVSVIIPAYNSEKYLSNCIKSLLNQSYQNIEIIVIDDGSKDSTAKIVGALSKDDNRVQYFFQNNSGVSSARNKGIDLANGKYMVFVDADDIVSRFYIEQFVYAFEQEEIQMASVKHTNNLDELSNELATTFEVINARSARQKMMTFSQQTFNGYVWEKMFLTEIVKNHIRFDERITVREDLLFIIEYLEYTNKCCYVDNALYFYRDNEDSVINNMTSKKYRTQIIMAEIVCDREPAGTELYQGAVDAYYESGRRYLECLSKEKVLTASEKRYWLNKQIKHFLKNCSIKQLKRVVSAIIQKTSHC